MEHGHRNILFTRQSLVIPCLLFVVSALILALLSFAAVFAPNVQATPHYGMIVFHVIATAVMIPIWRRFLYPHHRHGIIILMLAYVFYIAGYIVREIFDQATMGAILQLIFAILLGYGGWSIVRAITFRIRQLQEVRKKGA